MAPYRPTPCRTDFEVRARVWEDKADRCERDAPGAAAAHRRVAAILRECAAVQRDVGTGARQH